MIEVRGLPAFLIFVFLCFTFFYHIASLNDNLRGMDSRLMGIREELSTIRYEMVQDNLREARNER